MNALTAIPALVLSIAAVINGEAVAADNSQTARMCPASTPAPTAADDAMALWEKNRALYLHDLRLSSLEQREKTPPTSGYELGNTLIEADLYIAYAEADGLISRKVGNGRSELNMALTELKKADEIAPTDTEKTRIEGFRKTAMAMSREFDDCTPEETRDERTQYKTLRNAIGHMIKQVG